ncbi:uncharacterized protein L969DRAFT_86696 [Mixia osmundae IAM 14324]|uniref:Translation machinery-associated protein 20 n=1 Tax=Mixia osmundae (strain CBS 9802 / IAM 14324 / JCM 22182 / KY 12970) TaxID=764103 RepID=G7E9X3_MIXOS|nr:uncharacterized protein L969DRAFT_86696 [Mixia osmundae IAM 14324]KEI40076.1 hypothetical protein L969DRAFT_86696 [Mixia osmundae IAM 14324]GAA99442.1 hypothetical protein E5Q_06141 [Mixia osmundae IAM 14324]
MFKKFTPKEDIATSTKVKSSVQRNIRAKLLEQMPHLGDAVAPKEGSDQERILLEELWPKKDDLTLVKCREHVSLLVKDGEPLFFQHFDGPYYPTLKLLHRYPQILPRVQVDRGAIKFVLAGANIMCPGLTSKGASLPDSIPADRAVGIFAQGKEHACAIGLMKMSTDEIRSINKGHGIESVHYLADDLWSVSTL